MYLDKTQQHAQKHAQSIPSQCIGFKVESHSMGNVDASIYRLTPKGPSADHHCPKNSGVPESITEPHVIGPRERTE